MLLTDELRATGRECEGEGEGEDPGSGDPGSLLLADKLAVVHLRPVVIAQHVAAPAIHPERPLVCYEGEGER